MIPGILRLNSKVKYGMTSRNVPIYLFEPLNRKLSSCIVGCSERDVSSNALALVKVDQWETSKLTRGNLIRLLGKCGDQKAEEEALFYQYSRPTWKNFDTKTLTTPTWDGYETIRGFTFNVDPPGCLDIDDTVTIGYDGYIYITIADVASWMRWNPELFRSASRIGQTMYKRGSVVAPLLPIQEECSLTPHEVRYGLALKFMFEDGVMSNISFQKVQLTNDKSYTYENIYDSKVSYVLKELASIIAGYEVTDSHEWIEQLMIFYNMKAAEELVKSGKGLLRAQNPPDVERLKEYSQLGADVEFLANKSAYYVHAQNPEVHWGLGKQQYCHSTSPIRRFADIVNQMILCGYEVPPFDVGCLNERGRDAKKYERDMFFLFQVLNSQKREIECMTLNDHRVWVPDWKRIVTCKNEYEPGTVGVLKYSVDMDQPTWKRRMVFRVDV